MNRKERKPTVIIVDDDGSVRHSLQLLFKTLALSVVCYPSAEQFWSAFDPAQPGCVLLDVCMPGMSGLELQHSFNRIGALIPVIFMTGHGDVRMAVEAVQHGAFDFLLKPFSEHDLLRCVQRALNRDRELRAQIAEREEIRHRMATLTPREREILQLVTDGKSNKAMAIELGVSQRTVEIHRANLMGKMQAASLAHLVRMTMSS